jgi:hypothetical protein
LEEIDGLFEEAETYFQNKQEAIRQRELVRKKGYSKVQSKINTNLQGVELIGSAINPQARRGQASNRHSNNDHYMN